MAATGTPTPNIGLRIPLGTDPASVDDINYNSEVIDTKLGAVGSTSVQAQLDALNSKIANFNIVQEYASSPSTKTFALTSGACYMVVIDKLNSGDSGTACGMYMVQAHSGSSALRTIAQSAAISDIEVNKLTLTITTSSNYVGIAVIRLAQW